MAKTEKVRIQVLFSEDTPKGRFQDALYYTEDEYKNVKQSDKDKEKKKRKDNWLAIVSAPPVEVSAEERIAHIQSQIDELEAQKTKLGRR